MTGLKDTPMSEIEAQARACRDAAQIVAGLDSAARRMLLLAMAQALEVNAGLILAGNARDLAAARDKGVGSAMLDRLALDPPRLFAMAEAVREVAALPDPVGQVTRDACPASPGGKDWQPSSFSPRTGLVYIPHQNLCQDVEALEG